MLLKYVPFLELECRNISSLDFSKCDSFLAVVTFCGEISLWDAQTGKQYNPVMSSDFDGISTTTWIDDLIFICGLSDGSLVTIDHGTMSTEFVRSSGSA
jgi:WD40 repeat protein